MTFRADPATTQRPSRILQYQSGLMAKLRQDLEDSNRKLRRVERKETSNATQTMLVRALADLPTASAEREGWVAFVSDGRRSGETAGNGSGLPAYCGETSKGSGTYTWLTFYDNTAVTA